MRRGVGTFRGASTPPPPTRKVPEPKNGPFWNKKKFLSRPVPGPPPPRWFLLLQAPHSTSHPPGLVKRKPGIGLRRKAHPTNGGNLCDGRPQGGPWKQHLPYLNASRSRPTFPLFASLQVPIPWYHADTDCYSFFRVHKNMREGLAIYQFWKENNCTLFFMSWKFLSALSPHTLVNIVFKHPEKRPCLPE